MRNKPLFDRYDEDDGDVPVEFRGKVQFTKGKGILIDVWVDEGVRKLRDLWFPISQVEQINDTTFQAPTWLLREKGVLENLRHE